MEKITTKAQNTQNTLPKWETPQLFIEAVENSETGNGSTGPEGINSFFGGVYHS